MRTIFKYEVPILPVFELALPAFAEILDFQAQGKKFFIWALIDTEVEHELIRYFRIMATGESFEYGPKIFKISKHIGTAQMFNSKLMFHLFEIFYID